MMDLFPELGPQRDASGAILDDAHWTPPELARACVADLAEWLDPFAVLEPSAGGGAFVDAAHEMWPHALLTGVDIHPDAPGLERCDRVIVGDLMTADMPIVEASIGNRPFGGPDQSRGRRPGDLPYVGAHHILREIEHYPVVASILPLEWLGVGYLQAILWEPKPFAYFRPIRPRAWSVLRAPMWVVWIDGVRDRQMRDPLVWRRS